MQTRRNFIVSGITNLTTFVMGGGLLAYGRENARHAVKNHNQGDIPNIDPQQEDNVILPKEITNTIGLPAITIDHAIDFASGGVLGVAATKIISSSFKLQKTNRELASNIKRIQQLEKKDLPGVEKTLREFVEKEGIAYCEEGVRTSRNKEDDLVEDIHNLLYVTLKHIDTEKKAVQPFIEELKAIRKTLAEPIVEQLTRAGSDGSIGRAAFIEVLRTNKLIEYWTSIILEALENNSTGRKIAKNTVGSLVGKDLVGEAGVSAVKQTVTNIFQGNNFSQKLDEAMSSTVGDTGFADGLLNTVGERLKNKGVKEDDPNVLALEGAVTNSLQGDSFKENLNRSIDNAISESDLPKELVEVYGEKLKQRLDSEE